VGTEVSARLNLSEAEYDGFDPTGICVPFGATAAASKILGLREKELWNALALALNSCGGSFQSHVDGSLGVRFGRPCCTRGFSAPGRYRDYGPQNFLDGVYGYSHLYGRDRMTGRATSN
jgi:hypothetical protein